MLQDRDGQVVEAHSASAGLDYPGVGPQLAALAEAGRLEVGDRDRPRGRGGDAGRDPRPRASCRRSRRRTRSPRCPSSWPALEGSGAPLPDDAIVLLGFSGRGDKDLAALERFADVEPWDVGAMTIDELRAFCLSLPGTHEKETWGDAEHAGDVTFRVKDKIYVMTGPGRRRRDASARRSSSRPTSSPPSPSRCRSRAYVGRFGWVDVELEGPGALDAEVVRDVDPVGLAPDGPEVDAARARGGRRVSRPRSRPPPTPTTRPARAGLPRGSPGHAPRVVPP